MTSTAGLRSEGPQARSVWSGPGRTSCSFGMPLQVNDSRLSASSPRDSTMRSKVLLLATAVAMALLLFASGANATSIQGFSVKLTIAEVWPSAVDTMTLTLRFSSSLVPPTVPPAVPAESKVLFCTFRPAPWSWLS